MDSLPLSSIESLVIDMKKDLFSNKDKVAKTSAYDTAWLAMIPNNNNQENEDNYGPMFESCVNWILNNQNELGFWGDFNVPTIDCLPSTLACMVALKKWGVGESQIEKGILSGLYVCSDSSKMSLSGLYVIRILQNVVVFVLNTRKMVNFWRV